MTPASGTRLGLYEIVSALGVGGMGEVYRAHDMRLERDVAIKILPEIFAADPERLARFEREAKVLASLNHPNIAAIHSLEETNGVHALVLELVEGDTLADRIERGAIPIDEVLPIAKQVADALEAAHEQGIIHRDLKPANIKLREDGRVKVLDFGLAKLTEAQGAGLQASGPAVSISPTITSPAMMTGAGVILGTAAYMSPEQAKGRPADKRSDMWAYGCVLYEMLTGRRAFDGEDVSDTLAAVLRGEPDWSALPSSVPPPIRTLVQRCLVKDRRQRIADISVAQFLLTEPASLEGVIGASPTGVTTIAPPWKRIIPSVAAATLVGAAIASAIWWYVEPSPPSLAATRFSFTLPEGQAFTNQGRMTIAMSPDGSQMVYVANQQLWLRSMSQLDARPIPGTEVRQGIANPVFSPDGASLAFYSNADSTLKRIAVTGGAAVTICPADIPYGMSWGREGLVFGQGGKGILRVSPTGGQPEQLVTVNEDEVAHGPQILPDRQTLLFTLAKGVDADRWNKAQIIAQSLKSGERRVLFDGGADARYVPTGHIVYAFGGTLFAVPFNLRNLTVSGGAVPVLEGVLRPVPQSPGTGSAQFGASETGTLMYIPGPIAASSAQLDVGVFDRKGSGELLKLPPRGYEALRISPDGRQIVVGSDEGNEATVWIYDLAGSSAIRRVTFGGRNRFPVWSADGQRVTFQSDREGDRGIFWQRADGTGPAERLTKADPETSHVPQAWSSKGDTLLFNVMKGSNVSLWTLNVHEKKTTAFDAVTSLDQIHATFSPDGHWVAYSSRGPEQSTSVVYVQSFPATGAKYQISADGNTSVNNKPVWSRDGREIFYSPGPGSRLAVVRIATEPRFTLSDAEMIPRRFLSVAPPFPRNYDVTSDGRFIGVAIASQASSGMPAAPQIHVVLNWFEELKHRVPTR